MIRYDLIHKLIDENDSFLLTTHVNPDGDAIGCQIALYRYLQRKGKIVSIYNTDETPANLQFLDPDKIIRKFDSETDRKILSEHDALIAIDFNRLDRIGNIEKTFRNSRAEKICIDHHENSENFTEHMFVDKSYGSTGEIVFELIDSNKEVKLDYEIALPLYAAIMTDSGSFKYERTTSSTHLKAARLLETGVDPKWTARQIFDQGSAGRLRVLGRALDSIKLYHDGQLAAMVIRKNDLEETGTVRADLEGFINYNLSIKDVRIALFFYELDNGFKVSYRSVGEIPINKLAAEFGGGGHFHAAGSQIDNARIDEYYLKVIEAAKKYLNQEDN